MEMVKWPDRKDAKQIKTSIKQYSNGSGEQLFNSSQTYSANAPSLDRTQPDVLPVVQPRYKESSVSNIKERAAGMSRFGLHRTGSASYRRYLRSQQWGFRRVRWFRDCRVKGYEPACQVCGATLADEGSLDLHHVSYDGVSWHETEDQWVAAEADE